MRTRATLCSMILMLAAFAGGSIVSAQEALPETPPELRDFRLDPERAQPQPEPTPTTVPPVAIPPVIVPTLSKPRATPRPANPAPSTSRQVAPDNSSALPEPLPGAAQESAPLPAENPPAVETSEDISPTAPVESATPPSAVLWWQIAAGLLIGGVALCAVAGLKRRRRLQTNREEPVIEPKVKARPSPTAPPVKPVIPVTPARLIQPVKPQQLTLAFVPEKASISFTMLTIKGQLQLINNGQHPAKDMKLRAGLISASAHQEQAINAFYNEPANVIPKTIGEAKPGDRIGIPIELSVPLTQVESFPLGVQRLLVPIVVAELTYESDVGTGRETVHLACMIGREAQPPKPKMAPLRLDLGPRSFAPLGQRPVAG